MKRTGPGCRVSPERTGRHGERGIVLLAAMLIMLVLTVIGIASITVTGLESRVASFNRIGTVAVGAAESCVNTGVKVIQQTIDNAKLLDAYLDSATPPGPVPAAQQTALQDEIMGQSDNKTDTTNDAVTNLMQTLNAYTVKGDIDRLYAKPKAGGSLQFAGGYEGTAGGAAGGGVDILYRIDCASTNAATNAGGRISAVYSCTATGETCQKKI
jgi:Tfp pilus assembly protein PilX